MDWWKTFFKEDYLKQYEKHLTPQRAKREARIIEKVLQLRKGNKVLDLGCGQGRVAIELAKRGYDVTGLDYSAYLLDVAKRRAGKVRVGVNFVQEDMRRIDYSEEFDVVISWFTTFGYFNNKDNAMLIKKVSKALKKHGKFLIDITNKECLKSHLKGATSSRTWHDHKDFVVLESHEYDWRNSKDNCRRIFLREGKRKEYSWSLRLYSFPEIKSILSKAGFKIISVYGGYDLSRLTKKSWRMIIVAQKK